MITFTPFEPTFLTIGPIALKYYGLMYVLGATITYFFIKQLFQIKKIKITNDQILDMVSYGILGVLLGGRIGYILFYNLPYYLQNPLKIFAVWEGGMSFHGGMLGVILSGVWYCKKNKFSFYQIADIVIIPLFIGLALGRIGNFINGELVGRVTKLPWGMHFEGYEGLRHPSQLYESFKNLLIFTILFSLFKSKIKLAPGTLFWTGLMFYGFLRFLVEFVREPDSQIGIIWHYFTLGQLLCFPMFLIGLGMIIRLNRK